MRRVPGRELEASLLASVLADVTAGGDALVVVEGPMPPGVDLHGVPLVVAAVGADDAGVDVVAADEAELATIVATVAANPSAAVALAVLLRGQEERTVAEGLVAESVTYSMLQGGPEFARWLAARPERLVRPLAAGEVVLVEREGNELRLTLNRPEVRNAFSAAVRDGLLDALAVAEADADVHVVLQGAGPAFCSGGDLGEFGTAADPASSHRIRLARSVGAVVAQLAPRVTARVHGGCVGAGVELPAFAGRVVADRTARFRLPEVAMGLVPGAGGTVSITHRAGRQRTAWMALTGGWVDVDTALAWGLVDEIT